MNWQLITALFVFAAVAAFTPGPNNTMLLASGLNHGFRRTIPHVLGVSLGFTLMVIVAGLGLGAVFQSYPLLYAVLKYAGAAYLLWLAFLIARSGPMGDSETNEHGKPLTFIEAALFQWVNVKGLVVAISAVTAYAAIAPYPYSIALQALIFFAVTLAATAVWVMFGVSLRQFLTAPRVVRGFNVCMAIALVASLYPVFAEP